MATADVQGKFLWHELMTADPGAAGAFYGKVLGWTPQAWDKDPSYTVLLSPKGPVGGMMKPGADVPAGGSSAQWLAYIGAAHVEETAAAAQRLGGRVIKGASDIPGGGKYAILADPQGAVFGIHAPPASGSSAHAADAFAWHELATSDHAAALRFYRELFGWEQLGVHDMGAMGPYVLFGRAGQQFGGMFSRAGGPGPHWLAYVRVSSASKAADAARAAGGRVLNGPHQVPGGSWIAQLADPQGAAIAVNQPQAAGESAQPSKVAASTVAAARPGVAGAPSKPTASPSAAPASKPSPAGASARPAAPAAAVPAATPAKSPTPAAKPSAPAVSAPASAAAKGATPTAAARPASAVTEKAAPARSQAEKPAATPAAGGGRSRPARRAPARKSAARKGAGRRTGRTKTARPARQGGAARKRPMKKGSSARAARGAGKRASGRSAGARASGRRGAAGARKSARARGKTVRKKAAKR